MRFDPQPPAPSDKSAEEESRKAFEQAYTEWLRSQIWDPSIYSRDQIRGLVRQVFFPGWPRPARQVVLCGADPEVRIGRFCAEIGDSVAEQADVNVCVVEANARNPELKRFYGGNRNDGLSAPETADGMRKSSRQVSRRLWFAAWDAMIENRDLPPSWVKSQLAALRSEFEYVVLHCPPADCNETALLSNLADGVILVLEAHTTRRAAARRAKDTLLMANARLLGTVLSGRRFPIPEKIYRSI
jgi:hypothetical protein